MPASLNIRIADINFSVRSQHSANMDDLPDVYRSFVGETQDRMDGSRVVVDLELNNLPDIGKMIKIFDTDDSWSLYLDEDEYVMLLNPSGLDRKIVWAARFSRDVRRISIYCSELLLRSTEGAVRLLNPFRYPMDQILVMYALAQRDGALIHAAGLNLHGRGYIFPGKSGAGKSTLSRLFLGRDNIGMLSDDRVVARKITGLFEVFGTPWAGDAGIAENKNFPLSGMFFIHHANENIIKEIAGKKAIERLMPVTSIPWYDEKTMSGILSFCEDLVLNIPAYDLHFRPDKEVVDFFEKFVSA
jgi:hypothetical protein